jgi:hypothetical protein
VELIDGILPITQIIDNLKNETFIAYQKLDDIVEL